MTDLNRRAGELGEYGDAANEGGAPVDHDEDAPESPETDDNGEPDPSDPSVPVVAPAVEGGSGE